MESLLVLLSEADLLQWGHQWHFRMHAMVLAQGVLTSTELGVKLAPSMLVCTPHRGT